MRKHCCLLWKAKSPNLVNSGPQTEALETHFPQVKGLRTLENPKLHLAQRLQSPLIREYALNHIRDPTII